MKKTQIILFFGLVFGAMMYVIAISARMAMRTPDEEKGVILIFAGILVLVVLMVAVVNYFNNVLDK
jgi:hypothetical protein